MSQIKRPVNVHKGYHAHVYFDGETLEFASSLCQQAGKLFGLKIGTVHKKPIGPHPKWSCQIIFSSKHFDEFVPWIDENRNNLTILVHALTGDDLKDHTDYAYWLGEDVELTSLLEAILEVDACRAGTEKREELLSDRGQRIECAAVRIRPRAAHAEGEREECQAMDRTWQAHHTTMPKPAPRREQALASKCDRSPSGLNIPDSA